MRCDILRKQIMSEPGEGPQINTDIEIWREATAYHTALSPTGPRELARVSPHAFRPPQSAHRYHFFILLTIALNVVSHYLS